MNLCFELAILWKIANSCTSWPKSFKELTQPEGCTDPAKSLFTFLAKGSPIHCYHFWPGPSHQTLPVKFFYSKKGDKSIILLL